jgi:hypothetical protein
MSLMFMKKIAQLAAITAISLASVGCLGRGGGGIYERHPVVEERIYQQPYYGPREVYIERHRNKGFERREMPHQQQHHQPRPPQHHGRR